MTRDPPSSRRNTLTITHSHHVRCVTRDPPSSRRNTLTLTALHLTLYSPSLHRPSHISLTLVETLSVSPNHSLHFPFTHPPPTLSHLSLVCHASPISLFLLCVETLSEFAEHHLYGDKCVLLSAAATGGKGTQDQQSQMSLPSSQASSSSSSGAPR